MASRSLKSALKRVFLVATAAAAIAVIAAQPAEAKEYRRSCRASLEVRAAGTNTTRKVYQWNVYDTVSHYAQVNDARRAARRAIVTCMQTHWSARDADAVPYACQSQGSIEFREYPFVNLATRLRDDLCAARPNQIHQDVDLVLFIEGERGCVVDGGNINPATRVDITRGYRIDCPIPEHAPLPGVRLPGHDIEVLRTPGEGWFQCLQRCEGNTACRAWTWRRAGTSGAGSPEACLLKSEAGVRVDDPCCESGIKQ
jgi:hypothetical protein